MDDRVLNYGEASTPPVQTKVRSLLRRCASELLIAPRSVSTISAKSNLAVRKQFVMALDGPGISRDLFASPMAWSHSNCIGVAFKSNVYFQNLETRAIVHLCRVSLTDGLVHSVDWANKTKPHILALGTTNGIVQAWDSLTQKQVAGWTNDESPVGGMHWNEDVLAVGRKDGRVSLVDIRTPEQIQEIEGHKRQVHGVKWSPDGRYLATGDHTGSILVWDIRAKDYLTINDRRVLVKHNGPVKVPRTCLCWLCVSDCFIVHFLGALARWATGNWWAISGWKNSIMEHQQAHYCTYHQHINKCHVFALVSSLQRNLEHTRLVLGFMACYSSC